LDHLRKGDVFIVCKLDRLSRSLVHLLGILKKIDEAGAKFRSLEIGSRATIFELEGLGSDKRKYLKWLLLRSVAPKTKIESVITDDAFATMSEKLSTPLQFEYYLTRALEEAYKVGQKPLASCPGAACA
jgi:type II secretory pathway predicted ATPase ExeA